MRVIDAHHHLWKYDAQQHPWITEELSRLKQDFFPEDLKPLLDQNGVDSCVAVEARQSIFETTFLLEQAERHSFIAGVVGWLELTSDSLEEDLNWLKRFPKLVGFRERFSEESYDRLISRKEFIRGVSLLRKYNYTYDILATESQLPAVLAFTSHFSGQRFVLDHIAKPLIKSGTMEPWKTHIRELAQNPDVHCKVSGMVTEADWKNWKEDDMKPYLDFIFENFGVDRLMYGSDWPVCLLASDYKRVLGLIMNYISQLNTDEQEKIMGLNARAFYNLK